MAGIKNVDKNKFFVSANEINKRIAIINKLLADIEQTTNKLNELSLIVESEAILFPSNVVEGRLALETSTNVLYTYVENQWRPVIYN
jgi:hypothetical protein